MTRLLDWCVPASALTWGRLTKVWPWNATHGMDPKMVPPGVSVHCIDPHCTACAPWLGHRVLPEAVWAAVTVAQMPPGVVEIYGHHYPLVEFDEDPTT